MFKATIITIIVCTVGVVLLFTGIINLIDYIIFLDEKSEYSHFITLELLGGGLIIGLGSAYVIKDGRKRRDPDKLEEL